MCLKHQDFDVFNTQDEICLVFKEIKVNLIFFSFYTIHGYFPNEEAGGENSTTKNI